MTLTEHSSKVATEAGKFYLRTLGACTLSLDGAAVKMVTRKNLALIAYLAFHPTHSESRQRLAGLLWGESTEEKARTSLRQAVAQLSELRTSSGDPLISANRNEIRLNAAVLDVDVIEAAEELARGQVPSHFLENYSFEDAFLSSIENIDASFTAWLHHKRTALRNDFLRKLKALLEISNSHAETLRISSAILYLDNANEPACRSFMEASCQLGDFTGALRAYNELWLTLHNEFDTEPDQVTQALVASIKKGELRSSRPAVEDQRDGSDSAALLLPYETQLAKPQLVQAGTPDMSQFTLVVDNFVALGEAPFLPVHISILRSETLLLLARFREWQVFDSAAGVPANTGGYKVTCEAFQETSKVLLILSIYKQQTHRLLWSERFTLPEAGFLDSVPMLAEKFASATLSVLRTSQLSHALEHPATSLHLSARMLRAEHALMQWDRQEETLARKLILSILAENNQIAAAHAGYAASINTNHLVFPGMFRSRQAADAVVGHCNVAMNIDPLDRRSQLGLAWALVAAEDFRQAATMFRRAVELNRADHWSFVSAAEGLALCGEKAWSRDMMTGFLKRETALQPQHWAYLTLAYCLQEDFAAAAHASRNCPLLLNASGAWGAAALALLGRTDEAQLQRKQFVEEVRNAWSSDLDASDELIGRWLVQCFPVANDRHTSMLHEGFRRAGFSVG